MANLTNEKGELAIAIFAIFRHCPRFRCNHTAAALSKAGHNLTLLCTCVTFKGSSEGIYHSHHCLVTKLDSNQNRTLVVFTGAITLPT